MNTTEDCISDLEPGPKISLERKRKINYEIKGKKRKAMKRRDTKDRFRFHLSINNSKR